MGAILLLEQDTKAPDSVTPSNTPVRQPLHENRDVRQFVKFCLVGASSTAVNFLTLNILYHVCRLDLVPSLTIAFVLSVINGFFFNRRWTFREARSVAAHEQGAKFLLVNIVGWSLNTAIVVLVIAHFKSGGHGFWGDSEHFKRIVKAIVLGQAKNQHFGFWLVNGAVACATAVVVFWNYFANRHWTFKHDGQASAAAGHRDG